MFLNHDSAILDADSPDVLGELCSSYVAKTFQEPSALPHEVFVAGASIIFPPYAFQFSAFLDEHGEILVVDNLGDNSVLVCLPYDWHGSQLYYDSESFAAAIAYLSLTPRRVVGRPDKSLRSVLPLPIQNKTLSTFFSTINIGRGANAEIALIICGNEIWPDKCLLIEDCLDMIRICSSLGKLLKLNAEVLGSAKLLIGSDGTCEFDGLYSLTTSQFLNNRETILKSIERQIGK